MDSRRSESRQSSRTSRPSSSLGANRPASSLSYSTSSFLNQPKTPKPSAARYGGLAEKDLQKIQSSIRTAAKTTGGSYENRQKPLHEADEVEAGKDYGTAPEGSFIAETSFARAPLNSRLPPVSPHRAAMKSNSSRKSRSSGQMGTTKRQTDGAVDEADDISDSGSVIEEEEEDEETKQRREKVRRKAKGLEKEPLESLSAELQEALMVEDLLFVLMGIEGRYIEYNASYTPEDDFERMQGAQFVVDAALDPWIASVVERFLPLATYFTSITAFVEQYSVLEHGVINHALCAAIREMLRDYLVLLAQLEEQFMSSSSFTLQKFWLYLHPALHTLSLVHSLTTDLISLTVPYEDDDGSSSENDSEDSYAGGEGMANIMAEMKSATAAAQPSTSTTGWRAGPPKGGEVLHVLFSKLERTSGDPAAKELYSHLLLKASQPYVGILLAWISTGHLSDQWDEFIVRETKGINQGSLDLDYTDDYWERRYTLRDRAVGSSKKTPVNSDVPPRERGLAGGAVVPAFLEPWKDKILLAGKYLNVIRECGIEIEVPEGNRIREGDLIAMDQEDFFKRIDIAYTYANKTLLKLLLEEEHLASRLESIKQYFFINHGDVFTHFLDMAKLELGKKKKRIMLERLQTQLDLALRNPSSRVDDDPFKDDLKIVFEDVTVAEWLLKIVNQTGAIVGPDGIPIETFDEVKKETTTKASSDIMGWDAFNLDYTVKFPLSLVLSRKSITYYQMIFRHLLRLKHLERVFLETWTEHLKTPSWRKRSQYPELQAWKGRVFALRARMYDFIQQMFDFAVSEVLESRWAELKKRLDEAETVDQLLKDHDNFLNTCTNECLLTNEKLLDLFHQKLFNTCYVFANYTASFTRILVTSEHEANGDWANVKFKQHWDFLTKFEIHFNHHIEQSLGFLSLHAARENSGILPLILLLDQPQEGVVKLASSSSSTTASPPTNGGGNSGRCIRRKFHRPPASCIAPRQQRSISEPTPPTPPSRLVPPPSPPSATPTTTTSTTPAATNTPYSFLKSISTNSSVPHHLVFTGLALLLASGFIVRRLHSKNRYRTPPPTVKGNKKRKQDVVKSILIAQGQEKSEEGLNVAGSKSRSGGDSTSTGTETKSSNLLPSAACITSTSAAILQGFEKISSALSSTASSPSKLPAPSLHRSTSSDSPTREMPGDLRIAGDFVNGGKQEGGMKKGKNKKGKAAIVVSGKEKGTASSSDMSRTSSRGFTKEVRGESDSKASSAGTTDTGVQVSQVELEGNPIPLDEITPTSARGFDSSTEQSPSSSNPPRPLPSSSSDPPSTSTVAVQTSPHLLPYRDRSPISTPPRIHSPPPISSPAPTRPAAVPLPFDLHASFQAKPSSSTPTAEKEYSLPLSPSLSLTPSRSPSSSPSVSSGSPTSRRPASPSTRRSSTTSTSATPSLPANGSVSTSSSRSRKQARKASTGLNGKSIVGLPKSTEKGKDGEGLNGQITSERNEPKSVVNSKTKMNGRDRPAPIPIPSSSPSSHINGNDSTPQPQRRLSTASSAYSTSNFSLTSSGSPHSTDRVALPTMPPAMTMTPPDFARRASSTVGYDRDESLRWSSNSNARSREASLRGLGVELDRGGDSEDGSVEGSDVRSTTGDSLRGISPRPIPNGYFSLSTNPQSQLGRGSSTSNYFGSPDSSPLPSHRTIPSFAQPSASLPPQQQPWSPQSNNQNSSLMPYPIASSSSSGNSTAPNASRPPSRQSSLSVPPNSSQQQQIQLHQQQQQQAYAIAHVQAQAAAQYQHVVALQYQAQVQQQQQQQNQRQRRRTGDNGPAFDDTPSVPNGLVYPLGSTGVQQSQGQSNWHSGSPHPVSPMTPSYPHLAQAVSPTSTTFAPTAVAAHAQAQAQAQLYQNYMNQSAAYYLVAQGGGGGSSSSPHASPAHPTRPRINSSVSAVAVLGSASSNGKNGNVSSPVSASSKSMACPRPIGINEKQRQGGPTNVNGLNPFSPLGAGADSRSSSAGSNDLSVWKARAKEAEMEADRNAKELEIARWRLSVLEEEQRTNEVENGEALRALATRAMRAEARIKLLEETRKADQLSSFHSGIEQSPSPSPAAASPVAPRPMELPRNGLSEETVRAAPTGDIPISNGVSGSGLHPLSWLDLDSISFSTRPLNSSSRPPLTSSHSSNSNRKRSGRNSNGTGNSNGRRQSSNGNSNNRRKSSNNASHPLSPSLHLSIPSPREEDAALTPEEEEEDDLVIVLDAPKRRTPRGPSRRNSYAPTESGGGQADEFNLSITGGVAEDGSSYIDEDDLPTIEFDSDPTNPHLLHYQAGNSSDSQNGIALGEAERHPDYVGFLPGFLARARVVSNLKVQDETPDGSLDINNLADMSLPENSTVEEDDEASSLPILAPSLPFPIHSTPPQAPGLFIPVADSNSQPIVLHHPFPTRPSQIALPPSPPSTSPPLPTISPAYIASILSQ